MTGEAFALIRNTRHALTTRQKSLSFVNMTSTERAAKLIKIMIDVKDKEAMTRLKAIAAVTGLETWESAQVLRLVLDSNEPEMQLRGAIFLVRVPLLNPLSLFPSVLCESPLDVHAPSCDVRHTARPKVLCKDPPSHTHPENARSALARPPARAAAATARDAGWRRGAAAALAALAVGYLRCDGALPLLAGVLATDPSEEVRADALAALGELGDAAAVPLLVRALYEEPHWTCQLQVPASSPRITSRSLPRESHPVDRVLITSPGSRPDYSPLITSPLIASPLITSGSCPRESRPDDHVLIASRGSRPADRSRPHRSSSRSRPFQHPSQCIRAVRAPCPSSRGGAAELLGTHAGIRVSARTRARAGRRRRRWGWWGGGTGGPTTRWWRGWTWTRTRACATSAGRPACRATTASR